ncbi:MAG: site-specific DNA-methyltransferase [Elusimicrobia bacterium]|nr:site-specific DNA-methyltransferase [Elusimicrobiota bacterium]
MMPELNTIYLGDNRETMRSWPDGFVQTCVTSPPYFGLRDYQVYGQLGLESTPDAYVAAMVEVFREVRRVLRDDGTLWLNLGDSYVGAMSEHKKAGSFGTTSCISSKTQSSVPRGGRIERGRLLRQAGLKQKDLIGIPWMVALALRADGWYLRADIIWHKPNPTPESVEDRPTKAHEYVFLLAKSERYYYDHHAIKETAVTGARGSRFDQGKTATHQQGRSSTAPRIEDGRRNKRSVWTVAKPQFREAHFATFPPALITPCVLAGSPRGGLVLDPFMGAGTTGLVAANNGRSYLGCELNPDYKVIADRRISRDAQIVL